MHLLHASVGVILLAGAATASAQPICRQLDDAIRSAEMTMSSELASGLFDNSAPRENMRQAKIVNAWASVQATLTIMQMNKCPAYPRPVSERAYYSAAMKCNTAVLGARPSSSGQSLQPAPECKRESWAREEAAAAQ